ncbi:type VI secretion system baseplate subunit TssE [Aquabacterium sp. A7-Y]|uniref:type VI secretion system baseplate subunit TssE n=1 Tax=Aquabacterium sp. A7-Y TaxID=1349605 RepID=UPI00223D954D|nr:type VI secretion system baseplate subunit TssE [Aquabacterium sp. A7-Y]MCW7537707.1 type VI secretion system baseplate subunit TssE [Aquabacterium sp. A7-Y]
MSRYNPSLFEKLLDDEPEIPSEYAIVQMSIEQMKDSVARDVEALLNTRCGLPDEDLQPYPNARSSILSFGMIDFAGLSLANPKDREHICHSIETAIRAHEPRLRDARVSLELKGESVNKLHFSIHALLVVDLAREPVSFDAMLQPTTQQYSVRRARRAPATA